VALVPAQRKSSAPVNKDPPRRIVTGIRGLIQI
jgi:hypothetical protein